MSLIPLIGGPSWTTYFGTIALVVLVGAPLVFERGCSYEQDKAAGALLKARAKADEKSDQWREEALQLRKARDAEKDRIADRSAAELGRMRLRAERRPEAAASSVVGATGAELSRPDSEFLTRLAARADRLRAALGECQDWVAKVTK